MENILLKKRRERKKDDGGENHVYPMRKMRRWWWHSIADEELSRTKRTDEIHGRIPKRSIYFSFLFAGWLFIPTTPTHFFSLIQSRQLFVFKFSYLFRVPCMFVCPVVVFYFSRQVFVCLAFRYAHQQQLLVTLYLYLYEVTNRWRRYDLK